MPDFDVVAPEEPKKDALVPTPMALIQMAVEKGADADQIGKLMDLQLRLQANESRLRFEEAFERFKRNAPEILKTKHVSFATKGGDRTDYWHAELDKINEIIGGALLKEGISHSWESTEINGRTTVQCVLSGYGHTYKGAQLSAPADTSGGKNNVQAIGSSSTYLMRYTLFMTTGIIPKGAMPDDDGKTEGMPESAIEDYCIQMEDSSDLNDLRTVFEECWTKAKALNDGNARERLRKVYETRKRELLNGQH